MRPASKRVVVRRVPAGARARSGNLVNVHAVELVLHDELFDDAGDRVLPECCRRAHHGKFGLRAVLLLRGRRLLRCCVLRAAAVRRPGRCPLVEDAPVDVWGNAHARGLEHGERCVEVGARWEVVWIVRVEATRHLALAVRIVGAEGIAKRVPLVPVQCERIPR
eukprot:7390241-Prymnesium_polylepis.2